MSRVKLAPLENYRFSYQTSIRITDLNYGAHLGNDSVVTLLHEARARMLHQLGLKETDLGDGKTGFVQADLVVNYYQEGFAFEDIDIELDVSDIGPKHFRMCYRFIKNGQTMILAETGMVGFDFDARKAAPLPDSFLRLLDGL